VNGRNTQNSLLRDPRGPPTCTPETVRRRPLWHQAEESLHFGVLVARSQVEMQSILGDAVLGYQQKEEVGEMPSSFDAAGGSSTTSCGSFDVMRQPSASAQNAASRAGSRQSMLTFWIRRVKSSPYGSTIVSHVERRGERRFYPRVHSFKVHAQSSTGLLLQEATPAGRYFKSPPRPTSVRRSSPTSLHRDRETVERVHLNRAR